MEILGVKYITRKEACRRYSRSESWFKIRQRNNEPPFVFKLTDGGKVYYALEKTDLWFKENMKRRK